jgi:hypothetical protein
VNGRAGQLVRERAMEGAPGKSRPAGRQTRIHRDEGVSADVAGGRQAGPPCYSLKDPPSFEISRRHAAVDLDITESDSRLAETQSLLRQIERAFNLNPEMSAISWGADAQRKTSARGAHGLMENGRIFLHPRHYQPRSIEGRILLAHEVLHLAQRAEVQPCPGGTRPDLNSAEREAEWLARAFARGQAVFRPRAVLPPGAAAARDGTEATAPSIPGMAELGDLTRSTRGREIEEIEEHLRPKWWRLGVITDGDVEEVLLILQGVPFVVARSMVRNLAPDTRERLVDNIDDSHFRRFRTEVIAAYSALSRNARDEFLWLPEDPFDGMSFRGLSDEDHWGLKDFLTRWNAAHPDRVSRLRAHYPEIQRVLDLETQLNLEEQVRTAIEEETNRQTRRREAERLERSGALNELLEEVVRLLSRNFLDWAVTDDEALRVLDLLEPHLGNPAALQLVADRLESEGLFDRLFEELPIDRLFLTAAGQHPPQTVSARRTVFLRLINLRAPHKNIDLARRLLSTSFWSFDWMVSDEEAYLAFQLVRTVPERARAGFFETESSGFFFGFLGTRGDTFEDLLFDNLSQEMREAETSNFYTGGRDSRDQVSIRAQLLRDDVWLSADIGRLSGLIRMAIAAGDHEWLFQQSALRYPALERSGRYHADPFHEQIVNRYLLYDPLARDARGESNPRTTYSPELIRGTDWYEEGLWTYVNQYGIQAIDFLAASDNPSLASQSFGGEGLNLYELQDVTGGNLLGLRFVAPEQRPAAGAGRVTAGDPNAAIRSNFGDVHWDMGEGLLTMAADQLEIAAFNYLTAGLKIQSGRGTIRGLQLHMGYPTGDRPRQHLLRLRAASLRLNDLMFISTDSMFGMNRVHADDVLLRADSGGIDYSDPRHQPREGVAIPIPIFSPLLGLIVNLVRLEGASEDLEEGLLEPSVPIEFEVQLGSLRVDGLTTSSGTYLQSVTLEDVRLFGGETIASYKTALRRSLAHLRERREALDAQTARVATQETAEAGADATAARIDRQIGAAEEELRRIERAEVTVEALEPRSGELSGPERRRLNQARGVLREYQRGGVTLDITSARVTGLGTGQGAVGEMNLDQVHGHGRSATALLGFLTDSEALRRILRGPSYEPVVPTAERLEETGGFSIDLGNVRLRDLRFAGAIPTPRETGLALRRAEERLAQHPGSRRLEAERDRLAARHEAAVSYDRIARRGLGTLDQLTADELREFQRARQWLEGTALEIDEVSLTSARRELMAGGGEVGVHADDARVTGIRGAGWRIDSIHAVNFDLTGAVGGGLRGLLDFRENLRRAGVTGDSFEVLGIHLEDFGGEITRIATGRLEAGLAFTEGDTFLRTPFLAVEGVNITLTRVLLEAELRSLRARPESERTPSQQDRIRALEEALALADGFEQLLAEARTPAEERQIRDDIVRWQQTLGLRTLVIENLDFALLGLGNVLAENHDFQDQLAQGLAISGRGPEDEQGARRIFSAATLTGRSADEFLADPTALTEEPAVTSRHGIAQTGRLGALSGEVGVAHAEEFTRLDFRNVGLTELELSTARFGGPDLQFWTHGTSRLERIRVTGHLILTPRPEDPEARELSEVRIENLAIRRITADRLGLFLRMPGSEGGRNEIEGELESGSLEGIWAEDFSLSIARRDEEGHPVYSLGGRAGIAQVTDLRVRGRREAFSRSALDQLAAGRAFQTALTEAGGTVNARDLSMEFLGVEHFRLRAGNLNLVNGHLRSPDGRVRLWIRGLTTGDEGYLEREGDRWIARRLRVGTIGVPSFEWRAGTKHFSSTALTEFRQVELDGSLEPGAEGVDAFSIERLRIGEVVSQHLRFEEDGFVVDLRPQYWTQAGAGALQVTGILITDLDWSETGGVHAGRIRTGGARADLRLELIRAGRQLLDMGVGLTAESIDVSFLDNGQVITHVQDLAARVDGSFWSGSGTAAGGVTGTIDAFTLSDVVYDRRTGRVEIPEFTLPEVSLSYLHYSDDRYELLGSNPSGVVVLPNVTVALALELNRETAPPGGPSPPPVSRIEIQHLEVPAVTLRGLSLTLKQLAGGVTLRVPGSDPATLENFRLVPAPGDPAFTIVPSGGGWTPTGGLRLSAGDFRRLGFSIGSSLSGTTDAEAGALSIDFLSTGDYRVRLEGATLTRLTADLAGSTVSVMPGVSAHPGDAAVEIGTVTRRETGEVEVADLGIRGLVYDDRSRGINVDIQSAQLPRGFQISAAADQITFPSLEILEAILTVDDVMRLGGGGGDEGGGFELTDYRFMDSLNGHLNFTVDVGLSGYADQTFDFAINFVNGVFNFDQIESDAILEFHFFENNRPGVHQLVVGVDLPNLGDPESREPAPEAMYGLHRWTLPEEDVPLGRTHRVRVRSLMSGSVPSESDEESPVTDLRFYNVDADLSLLGEATIDFGPRGRIHLGPAGRDGILHFTASGDSASSAGIILGLQEINASIEDLLLLSLSDPEARETTEVLVNSGWIHVEDFHDAQLAFSGMYPQRLTGTIGRATARNLTVRLVTRAAPPSSSGAGPSPAPSP